MKFIKVQLLALLTIFSFIPPIISEPENTNSIPNNLNLESDDYYQYCLAEVEFYRGNFQKSFQQFKKLLKESKQASAKQGMAKILNKMGKYDQIVEYKDALENDHESQLILIQAYLAKNEKEKAFNLLQAMIKKAPDNSKITFLYASLLTEDGNYQEALKIIDNFLKNKTDASEMANFLFLKAQIYLQTEDINLAETEINRCLEINNNFENAWLVKALILEFSNKIKEALSAYKKYLTLKEEQGEPNILVQQKYIQLLFSNNDLEGAEIEMQKLPNKDGKFFFDNALINWKKQNFTKALECINTTIKMDPKIPQAFTLKIEILFSLKDITGIMKLLEELIVNDPTNKIIYETLSALKKYNLSADIIIKTLEKAKSQKNLDKKIYIYLGDIYASIKHIKKALENYEKALELNNDTKLQNGLLYQVALLYFMLENKKASEKFLLKILDKKTVFPPAYNLLAYIYASTNQKFEYANNLIDEALKIEPNNAAYIDTKGFVKAKLGQISEAVELFKKALSINPQNKEIREHLLSYANKH